MSHNASCSVNKLIYQRMLSGRLRLMMRDLGDLGNFGLSYLS
jgi:hypothetical protein